jgi:oligopeptide/dipeptide ABC transporter ATP-binding protein
MSDEPAIEVRDLTVEIREHGRRFVPVDGVSFQAGAGQCVGLVGESGCGKSLSLRSLLGLLPQGARVTRGTLRLRQNGVLSPYDPVAVRGRGIAMVFQEPMTALNPLMRVGQLIRDAYRATHDGEQATDGQISDLMGEVGIPGAAQRMRAYPHQLSGGLRQRVMIAMALASEPSVLLCDEPTTALDVTVQEQILILLERIRRDRGLAIIYVSHDLAVISEICDEVSVMYAGRIVESGPIEALLRSPAHTYTVGLIASVPRFEPRQNGQLRSIGGMPPDPRDFPTGCRFHPRCSMAVEACRMAEHRYATVAGGHLSACIRFEELVGESSRGLEGGRPPG